MALDTETGGENTRSYASVTYLDGFLSDMGLTLKGPDGSDITDEGDKEQSLRLATLAMGRFSLRWPGTRATGTQALDWPRSGATYRDSTAIPSTIIPREVQDATCELAVQAAANPGRFRSVIAGRAIKKVDGSAASVEWFDKTAAQAAAPPRDVFTLVEDTLQTLLLDPPSTTTGTGSGSTSTALSGFAFGVST